MSDLKTFWTNPGMPASTDLAGDTITERGTDPNVTFEGTDACNPLWNNPPVPYTSGQEDSNPISGLPTTPSRWEPSSKPPELPSLQDRRPGTIDEQ
jgi:hypothetical protein